MNSGPEQSAFVAAMDDRLEARVTGSVDMLYSDGPSEEQDRPPHVLAASGLSAFCEHLAVIQDDANWLALIDDEQKVFAVPLPRGPDGKRVFTKARGNEDAKNDFEACISVLGQHGRELIGFASGSREDRVWLLRVWETTAKGTSPGDRFRAAFVNADRLYAMWRDRKEFCGAGLNIEGAVALDDERIMLFQRGNASPAGHLQPVDATAEIAWSELSSFIADPVTAPLPSLRQIRTYDLGAIEGVRLTFSDAEHLGNGRILYSASAEDPASGEIAGSVLGVLQPDGQARWTRLFDSDGETFTGKIEGLTCDIADRSVVHFVIDDDDDRVPSKIYRAVLNDGFLDEDA